MELEGGVYSYSPRIQVLMAKAEELDRKAYAAAYADVRRTYMQLAEQARGMARQLKALDRTRTFRKPDPTLRPWAQGLTPVTRGDNS
jgi:hypothetical protein